MNILSKFPLLLFLPLMLVSCGGNEFKVKGNIEGAEGTVVLERASAAGEWLAIDSAKLSKSGAFSISGEAPAAPDIYRLRYDGRYLYFPVDSLETIKIATSAAKFDTDFTLSGSSAAEDMMRFEKQLQAYLPYRNIPDSTKAFKRRVYAQFLQDSRGSVMSYYVLTKTVGNLPLFDPAAREDAAFFAAVATAFKEYRPSDPRAAMLEDIAIKARRKRNNDAGHQAILNAAESGLVEIALPDRNNNIVQLSQCVGGIPTLLVFTRLDDAEAPALNVKLRRIVESGQAKVYQVCYDADRLQWREASASLPWTVVYAGQDVRPANDYMVSQLPTIFRIDANGNITERVSNL